MKDLGVHLELIVNESVKDRPVKVPDVYVCPGHPHFDKLAEAHAKDPASIVFAVTTGRHDLLLKFVLEG